MSLNFGSTGVVGEVLPGTSTSIPTTMTFATFANINAWTPRFGGTGYKTLASIPTALGETTISLSEFGAASPAFRIAGDSSGSYFQFDAQFSTAITNDEHYAMTMDFGSVSNTPTFYEGGSALTTITSSAPTGSFSSSGVGNWHVGTTNYSGTGLEFSFTGELWGWVMYDVILSAAEIQALADGVDPRLIRPGNIYRMVIGDAASPYEWVTGGATTNYGAGTTLGANRTLIRPAGSIVSHSTTTYLDTQVTFTSARTLSASNVQKDLESAVTFTGTRSMTLNSELAGDLPLPFSVGDGQDIAIYHYGQSLSIGQNGEPALTTTQPYDSVNGSVTPLFESTVETAVSASVNSVRDADGGTNSRRFVGNTYGLSGADYTNGLRQGTAQYTVFMNNVTSTHSAIGSDLNVAAVCFIHGESDEQDNCNGTTCSAIYRTYLPELLEDLDTDIKAITGQTRDLALFVCQMSSWTRYNKERGTVCLEQLAAADASNYIQLVCAKYAFGQLRTEPYASDGVHLNNNGYRLLGDYYGQALAETFVHGRLWAPLRIVTATAATNTITLTYSVPSERMGTTSGGIPLVLDVTGAAPAISAGATTYGFEVSDSSPDPRYVTGVSVSGTEVTLTLNGNVRSGTVVQYAMRGIINALAGPGTSTGGEGSARGNLRDTSSAVGYQSSEVIPNWAVHQEITVTGGVVHSSSIAEIIEDRNWTWGYTTGIGNEPATGASNWPATFGGAEMAIQTGTAQLLQSTTIGGVAAFFNAIGTARTNRGIDFDGAVYQATDSVFDSTADEDVLVRFIGDIQRPSGTEYLLWQGAVDANNRMYVQFTSAGNIAVVVGTSGQNLTYAVSAILPATATLGLIDIYVRKDPQLQISIAVNGTVNTSTAAAAGGSISGVAMSLCGAFNNSGPMDRTGFAILGAVGHAAGWWNEAAHDADYASLIYQPVYLSADGVGFTHTVHDPSFPHVINDPTLVDIS